MVDFLRTGWQISTQVCVDFTASNGDPRSNNSLHCAGQTNQYDRAISQVVGILEAYDTDKLFPVWGFGGKPQFLGGMNMHCYPLNGNSENPNILGAQGIL
jgi:hypothetical protein